MHEKKSCQRCNTPFECKPGSITQCQCFEIKLSAEQRAYLEQKYGDCLCRECLVYIQQEFELFKEKFIYK
ncbi:MAG TPA: cysteine-rich CWC family protein [Chitinophagaceae bacterium]